MHHSSDFYPICCFKEFVFLCCMQRAVVVILVNLSWLTQLVFVPLADVLHEYMQNTLTTCYLDVSTFFKL